MAPLCKGGRHFAKTGSGLLCKHNMFLSEKKADKGFAPCPPFSFLFIVILLFKLIGCDALNRLKGMYKVAR